MLALAALFMWLDLPSPADQRGLSGSMFANSAPTVDWETEGEVHSLDDPFHIRWAGAASDNDASAAPIHLFASRNDSWEATDCDLGVLQGSDVSPDAKRFAPRNALCLDAGSWRLFAVQGDQVVHLFEEALQIANGVAALERVSQTSETGFKGGLEVQLQMHRPAAEDGFDGVRDLPVDIWITDGKQVCVASAGPVTAVRDPVRSGLTWKSSVHQARVALGDFQKVANYTPFDAEGNVAPSTAHQVKGNCDLAEGTYRMLVGPTERAWANEGRFFVHAPAASVDDETIRITLPAGEVGETTLRLRNRSSLSTKWSAQAVSRNDAEWLIGFANREVKGKAGVRGVLTVSAQDLQPGRYDAEIQVTVDDFYGTQVTIPVELNVVSSRVRSQDTAGAAGSEELPGTLQLGNYPNPFSSSTTVRIELPESSNVRITVYDMTGREVRNLHDGYLSMGTHEFRFDADDLPSGTYLYRVNTDRGQETGTMTLVK